MPDAPTPAPELAMLALRYAAGDLPAKEATAFEERLADDQPARDALAEAIRLSASAVGQPPPVPSGAVRIGVRDRLFPTWLTRLFPRRSYRGHPAAWATLGGTVAATTALLLTLGGEPTAAPPRADMPVPSHPIPPRLLLENPSVVGEGNQAVAPMPAPADPGPRADRAVEPPPPMPATTIIVCGQANG